MSGFLKRDLSLQAVNAKFYLCFVLAFAGLAVFTDFAASFASLYLVIFAGTSIMSLFSYDEANHWEAYAASAPNGRRATVDARYLLAALIGSSTPGPSSSMPPSSSPSPTALAALSPASS